MWLSPAKPSLNCLWSCSYCNEQISSHLLALLKYLSCGGVLSWGKHSSNRNNRWFHLPVLSVTICSAWDRSDFAFQSTCISLDCVSLVFKVSYFSYSLTPNTSHSSWGAHLRAECVLILEESLLVLDLLSSASCLPKGIFMDSYLHREFWHHALSLDLTLG